MREGEGPKLGESHCLRLEPGPPPSASRGLSLSWSAHREPVGLPPGGWSVELSLARRQDSRKKPQVLWEPRDRQSAIRRGCLEEEASKVRHDA